MTKMHVRHYCRTCCVISCYERFSTIDGRFINDIFKKWNEKSSDINGSNIGANGQFLNCFPVSVFTFDCYDCSCGIVSLIKTCIVHFFKINMLKRYAKELWKTSPIYQARNQGVICSYNCMILVYIPVAFKIHYNDIKGNYSEYEVILCRIFLIPLVNPYVRSD